MVPGFFDNLRDYSEIKLRILGKFLPPWSAKLGFMSRRGNHLIWYVDAFAGRGQYLDGSDGSPLVGLRQAEHTRLADRGYELACFFVELNQENWNTLESLIEPFRRGGVHVRSERGRFSSLIVEIEKATQGSPILLFIDPFGLSPLEFSEFQILLRREAPTDLILTFQHRALHRLATEYPHIISSAIGSETWQSGWDDSSDTHSQIMSVLSIFADNIRHHGRFLRVLSYPIRERVDSAPRYYLLFASRHYDAFELWNDEIAQEESALTSQQYQMLTGQTTFLPALDEQTAALNLLDNIRGVARTQERFTRRELVRHFVLDRGGQYHTGSIKKAVQSLLNSGELLRDHLPRKGINDDTLRLS